MVTVAVLCGGKGTRIASIAGDLPKALLPVAGRPFIERQLRWLASSGATRVVLLTGYRGDQIEMYVGNGRSFGLDVVYSHDGDTLRGTGGALRKALPMLGDPFLTLYGDSLLPVPIGDVARSLESDDSGVMAVYENHDTGIRSNVLTDGSFIIGYDKQAAPGTMTHIDYGINVFRACVFDDLADGQASDLGAVHQAMIAQGKLRAFPVHERWYEIGSPEGLAETEQFVRSDSRFGGMS